MERVESKPKPFSAKEILALFPLLLRYYHKNQSQRGSRLIHHILRPRKDRLRRIKQMGVMIRLQREINDLDKQIQAVLHPDGPVP